MLCGGTTSQNNFLWPPPIEAPQPPPNTESLFSPLSAPNGKEFLPPPPPIFWKEREEKILIGPHLHLFYCQTTTTIPQQKKRNFPSADPFKFLFRPHPGTKKLLLFREINISGGESLIILPASACNYSRPKYHPLRPNSRKRVEKMKLVKFATTTPHFPPGSHISGRTWPLFPYNFFSFFSLPEID